MNRILKDHGAPDYALERELEELHDSLQERKARRLHVFKCPVCGNEDRIDENDLKPWSMFCGSGNCSNFEPVKESFIEVVNGDGEVTAVIV